MNNLTFGLVGVGNMGFHFAERLLIEGYKLVIHDKDERKVGPLRKYEGVTIVNSPKDVANQSEFVFVSLPTPDVVSLVALGENGLIHGSKIKSYIDLSTTGQSKALEIASKLRSRNIKVLDSPVSGGVPGAEKGTLAIMVSGPKDVFKIVEPLLNVIGKNIFYVGDKIGQGQVVKVLNNLLSATAMAITSEAVLVGQTAEIDPNILINVFNASSGRNTATTDKFPKAVINREFNYGFSTRLMYKDVKLCINLAEELNLPMWLGTNVMQMWKYLMTQGAGNRDFTTVIQYLEKMAGVSNELTNKG